MKTRQKKKAFVEEVQLSFTTDGVKKFEKALKKVIENRTSELKNQVREVENELNELSSSTETMFGELSSRVKDMLGGLERDILLKQTIHRPDIRSKLNAEIQGIFCELIEFNPMDFISRPEFANTSFSDIQFNEEELGSYYFCIYGSLESLGEIDSMTNVQIDTDYLVQAAIGAVISLRPQNEYFEQNPKAPEYAFQFIERGMLRFIKHEGKIEEILNSQF